MLSDICLAAARDAARPPETTPPAWGAVISMSLGVFALVTAEVLPASLLRPLAEGLGITEGAAGQAVTVTAVTGFVTSLFISTAIGRLDRRWVLIAFSVLLVVANVIAASASGIVMLLIGRLLAGVALGGFWSLSVAVLMRLVPERDVPRALSIMFMGVSAATVLAIPTGVYLGGLVGWRGVFLAAAGLALSALLLQILTLPPLPAQGRARPGVLLEVLRRPSIGVGMTAALLAFAGHFTFFTYIRPFLEGVTGLSVDGVSLILLGFGLANVVGTYLIAHLIRRSLRLALVLLPLVMAVLAIALTVFGGLPVAAAVLIALWGVASAGVPVSWSTWVTRTIPDQAEAGGSLIVAAVSLAIAMGAGLGGAILDLAGPASVFLASGLMLTASFLIALSRVRLKPAASDRAAGFAEH